MPSYITVDWDNPEEYSNNEKWYIIIVKSNYDALNMSNYLAFKDDKYIGRFARK